MVRSSIKASLGQARSAEETIEQKVNRITGDLRQFATDPIPAPVFNPDGTVYSWYLNDLGLTGIPPSICDIEHNVLYLGDNQIQSLPDWFGKIRVKFILGLERNPLQSVLGQSPHKLIKANFPNAEFECSVSITVNGEVKTLE